MKYFLLVSWFVFICISPVLAQSANTGLWQRDDYMDNLSGKNVFVIGLAPTSNSDNDVEDSQIYIRCKNNILDLQVDWIKK